MPLQALNHDLTNHTLLNNNESILKDLPETILNPTPPGFTNHHSIHLRHSAQYLITHVLAVTPSNLNKGVLNQGTTPQRRTNL